MLNIPSNDERVETRKKKKWKESEYPLITYKSKIENASSSSREKYLYFD